MVEELKKEESKMQAEKIVEQPKVQPEKIVEEPKEFLKKENVTNSKGVEINYHKYY